jgi:hypothetical protein
MAKLSLAEALKKYGYVGTLANGNPELKKILMAMAAKNASVEEFTRAVQDSAWWKNSADSVKQYQVLQATKPGEFRAQQGAMVSKVRRLAAQLGVRLTEGHNSSLSHLVTGAMQFGWSEDELRSQVGSMFTLFRGHEAGGDAGKTTQQLRQIYASYGVPYSEDATAKATRAILSGKATIDTYTAQAIQSAKSRYAGLSPQIDEGMTVHDIADPYMQLMASTLEMPQGKVDLNNRRIQQALTARDDKGKPTVQPLWQFEQGLKTTPEWDKTKNATNAAFDMVNKIGKDWGFV